MKHAASRHSVSWGTLAAGAVLVFVVVFWRLGAPSFWDPDEAHYAETTRELLATRDWWAPFYNEQAFFDKPIFFHQLQALGMLTAGQNELGARLVPAVAAVALVLLTGWAGAALLSADVGLVAALLLGVSPGVFGLSRYAILDTVFTAFLFGGVSLVAVAALRSRPRLQYPGYLLVACAVLVKGPLGLALSGLTMLLGSAMSVDVRRRLFGLRWVVGLGIVLGVAAPWFAYMYLRFGHEFVAGYVLDENLQLYATNRFGSQPAAWFYIQILAVGLLPWTGLAIGRLVDDVRAAVAHRERDSVEVLLWAWTIAVVGFFTLSRFKLDHYVFPASPALCLLCARAWSDLRAAPQAPEHRGARVGLLLVGPLLVLLGVSAGYFLAVRLDLPPGTMLVPVLLALAGGLTVVGVHSAAGRPPRVPWIGLGALAVTYAGVVMFVMPALEGRKVVPDVARWVSAHADSAHRVATYRLNRWNPAFRFYVDHHTTMLDTPEEAVAFFNAADPFYCLMLEPAFEEFVARGVPLTEVHAREGMWVTSGRTLWRRPPAPTRFVVVTRALPGQVERHAGDDGVRPEEQRPLDEKGALVVQ